MTKTKIVLGQCRDCGRNVLLRGKEYLLEGLGAYYWKEAVCLECGCVFPIGDYQWASPVFTTELDAGTLIVGAEQEL